MRRAHSWLLGIAAVSSMAALFWFSALIASNVASLLSLAVNVHGLSPIGYAGDSSRRLAPLASRIIDHARGDAARHGLNGLAAQEAAPVSPSNTKPEPTPGLPKLPIVGPLPAPTPVQPALPIATPSPSLLPAPGPLPPAPTALPTGPAPAPTSALAPLPT